MIHKTWAIKERGGEDYGIFSHERTYQRKNIAEITQLVLRFIEITV